MAESLFIKVDEVGELLGISRAEAYRIIKKLNSELAYILHRAMTQKNYIERTRMVLPPEEIKSDKDVIINFFFQIFLIE